MRVVPPAPRTVRFGEYEVDLPAGCLFRRGDRVRLREQSFEVLAVLLEHAGEVVAREQLYRHLWSEDTFVDFDNNLNTAIARLRAALHDSAEHPRFIETLPKRGYRFIGEVSQSAWAAIPAPCWKAKMVVLPFANLSGDPQHEYFGEAITDEFITELARLAPGQLGVIARTTAMQYKGRHQGIACIARELEVDYVLEGSVRPAHQRLSINVQLIQVKDGTHLFAQRYDCQRSEFLATVNAVSKVVVGKIGVSMVGEGSLGILSPPARKPTEDLIAYDLYLQSRHHLFKENPESITNAKQCLEKAIERDPEFAVAYDGLAEIYWYLGFFGYVPPRQGCLQGMFYALRAIEIDNSLAETHALLGMYRKELDYDWAEVQREMQLALALNPSSPVVRMRYAISGLMVPGQVVEAIAEMEAAIEVDPLSPMMRCWLGVMYWLGRRYDQAIEQGKLMVELGRSFYLGYGLLGLVWRDMGVFDQAITAHRTAAELSGGSPLMQGWLGLTLAQAGEATEAREILHHLHSLALTTYVPATSLAWTYLGLGETDSFFEWMERAIDDRDHMVGPIKSYPFFDPVRSDPRFPQLLRKMNLEA